MIDIADAGEIKARVTIEYDGGGIDQAKSDLQSLAEIAGGSVADGTGKASEGLAQLEEQAGKTSDSVAQLSESASSLEKPFSNAVGQITSVSEALDEHQGLIESTGKAYEALQGPIGDTAVMLGAVSDPMLEIAKNAETMQGQMEDLGGGFQVVEGSLSNVVPLLPQLADNLHDVNDAFATQDLGKFTDNMSAFQDALANPAPFNAIRSYLNDTGQTWDDFANSIGSSKSEMFSTMSSQASLTKSTSELSAGMDEYNQNAVQWDTTSSGMNDTIAQGATQFSTMSDNIVQANKQMGGFNDTVVQANKGMNEFVGYGVAGGEIGPSFNAYADINKYGGVSSAIYGPDMASIEPNAYGGVGSIPYGPSMEFANASMTGGGGEALGLGGSLGAAGEGLMGFLNNVAMPLMAVQQIGSAVQMVSTGIYNMSAVAEGPAAHSMGSFTGTVDALGQASQKAASSFSEGFGQGVLPTLNAMNHDVNQTADSWGWFGKSVGGVVGFLGDIAGIGGVDPQGGAEGLVNMGASIFGMAQPFTGPGPQKQTAQDIYAAQQAQQQQIIQMNAQASDPAFLNAQVALSTSTMFAQANNPTYLDAQAYLGHQTVLAQQAEQSYVVSHYNNTTGPMDPNNAIFQQQLNPLGYGGTPNPNAAFFNSFPGGPDVTSYSGNQNLPMNYGGNAASNNSIWGQMGQSIGNIGSNIGNWWNNLFGGNNGPTPTSNVVTPAFWDGSGTCFPAGTQVLMSDAHTTKPIEALRIGDSVLAHDGTKHVATTVLARIVPLPKRVYKLTFLNGNSLTLTDSHPISTEQGWKSLSPSATKKENPDLAVTTLLPGDIVHTVDGVCTLISIEPGDVVQIFNITVGDPHTFYADGILVHNKTGADIMSQVANTSIPQTDLSRSNLISSLASNFSSADLTHTFTATVTWADQGLNHAATAAAQWAESNLVHNAVAAAQWAEQGLTHMATAAATWAEQGLTHAATAAATWAESNLIHPAVAAAQWAESNLTHAATAAAQWAESNLIHPVVAAATWAVQGIEHTFEGIANWVGQNLTHTFEGIATWVAQGLSAVFSPSNSTPSFASGVDNYAGGYAMVGEAGAELVYLPQGSSVYPQVAGGGFQGLNNQLANNNQNQQPQMLHHQTILNGKVIAEEVIPLMAPMLRQLGRRNG